MEYLLLRLYGTLASWGEIAVGESRHSAPYPSRSALLGLLGAALGVTRDDDGGQQALAQDYRLAVKLLSAGQLLRDYHTAQAPDSVGKFRYRTRRDELVVGRERLGTILSSREYRTDALALVAVHAEAGARWSLEQLAEALGKPKFHLYLGRKSCPLGAPLNPQLLQATGFRQALNDYAPGELLTGLPAWDGESRWLPRADVSRYYWEGEADAFDPGPDFDPAEVQTLIRHDQPLSRRRWQFQPRREQLWLNREVG